MALKNKRLKKQLNLVSVYAIATGATLSSGFFLLPGLAANAVGPAIALTYFLAVVPLVPAMFSMVELSTAMPRSGGAYYFIDRSMGPMSGMVGGIGTWLALLLKSSFALVGIGAYLSLIFPEMNATLTAVILALVFGGVNMFGAGKTGGFQILLVVGLLAILFYVLEEGVQMVNYAHFTGFFDAGADAILSTTGLVYISYIGITKVASVSEEVTNPERNLPLGIILSLITALVVYTVGTTVMVGIVPMEELKGSLVPVALTADYILGTKGVYLVVVAAVFAFSSAANAGILSASRYPVAMSRDDLLPGFLKKLNVAGVPVYGILLTVGSMVFILLFLDAAKIAKLASAFQLFMFALICIAVIVMRESKLDSYDPGYKSPFYPWTQIIGVISAVFLITRMGIMPILFSLALALVGVGAFFYYARKRVNRGGAIFHIFERLGRHRFAGLDTELREILKEKGLRKEDPFDVLVTRAHVIELGGGESFEVTVKMVSRYFATALNLDPAVLTEGYLQGTRVGATPVSKGAALPHVRLKEVDHPMMVFVRSEEGVLVEEILDLWGDRGPDPTIHAFFFLVSPEDNPGQHLRVLAQIAERVDDPAFMHEWRNAKSPMALKEILLHDDRFLSLVLHKENKSQGMIGLSLADLRLPEGCLVALIHRGGEVIIPRGNSRLEELDRLTIIGEPAGIHKVKENYCPAGTGIDCEED